MQVGLPSVSLIYKHGGQAEIALESIANVKGMFLSEDTDIFVITPKSPKFKFW